MKVLYIIVLVGVICIPGFSQTSSKIKEKAINTQNKIHWYTFEEATKINSRHPKKIFMDVYTDWCGWCKRLDAVTFSNPEIVKYINANFYAVKFDAERKDVVKYKGKDYINRNPYGMRQPHDLAAYFLQGKMSYPTVVFLNEKMDVITPVAGYMGPRDFEGIINFIGSDAYQKEKFEDFKSSFQGKVTE